MHGLIEFFGGVGLFDANIVASIGEQSHQPVSWVLMNEFQGMGMLQTVESERKKGYASLVVKAFCSRVANEHNDDVVAFVVETNAASQRLLTGLGFEMVGKCVYLDYMCD